MRSSMHPSERAHQLLAIESAWRAWPPQPSQMHFPQAQGSFFLPPTAIHLSTPHRHAHRGCHNKQFCHLQKYPPHCFRQLKRYRATVFRSPFTPGHCHNQAPRPVSASQIHTWSLTQPHLVTAITKLCGLYQPWRHHCWQLDHRAVLSSRPSATFVRRGPATRNEVHLGRCSCTCIGSGGSLYERGGEHTQEAPVFF